MVRSRSALLLGACCLLGASTKLSGCITGLDLEGRPCPCVAGYHCCRGLCLGLEDECPTDSPAEAGAGAVPSQGGGGPGGMPATPAGAGAPEAAGQPGTPEEPTAGAAGAEPMDPEWRPVGNDDGVAPPLTHDPNLALAPDGTPYIAYRACEPCQPIDVRAEVPVVLKLGATWERLPNLGTITKSSPALAIAEDGTPHVLVDYEQQVKRFDGQAWSPVSPQFELAVHMPATLGQDAGGRFHTLLSDEANVKLVVARVEDPTTYSFLGTSVSADPATARLCVVGNDVYRAYVRDQGPDMSRVFIDHFNGGDWDPWGDFEGRAVELTASAAGDVYAAISGYELHEARIFKRTDGTWGELQLLTASWHPPLLQLSDAGDLYLSYLVEDFPNVAVIGHGTLRDLNSRDLPNGSVQPALRLWQTEGAVVPIISYLVGGELIARKYQ